MTDSTTDRALRFVELHAAGTFVMANVWDAGTARIATGLGFPALATSSAASAYALGRVDGEVTREEALAHARAVVEATPLPVSADLENGFGDAPAAAAETVRLAAGVGLAGCSIEDAPRGGGLPYPFAAAVARVRATASAVRTLGSPFLLTARAENHVRGVADLDDTIARLRAFAEAGADVLFAPGLPDLDAVRAVCSAVAAPVSFMAGIRGRSFTVADLAAAGVRRVSVATSLYRAAMSAFVEAAREVRERGTFGYLERSLRGDELERYLRG